MDARSVIGGSGLFGGEAVIARSLHRIAAPAPYAGVDLNHGFTAWARDLPTLDEAEAALVLRRAVFISAGRGVNLDAPGRTTGPRGGCWVWQPERAEQATRNIGSTLDFTARPEALTRDDRAWLDFAPQRRLGISPAASFPEGPG